MKYLVGDCRKSFGNIFDDATEMAQAIEDSERISMSVFLSLCNAVAKTYFVFGKNKNLVWAYDPKKDVHYFYL